MHVLSYPRVVRITLHQVFRNGILRELGGREPSTIHRIPGRLRQIVAAEHDLATGRPDTLGAEHDVGRYALTVDLDTATCVVLEVARDVLAEAEVDADRLGVVEEHPVDLATVAVDAHAPSRMLGGKVLRGHVLALVVEEVHGCGGVDYGEQFLAGGSV